MPIIKDYNLRYQVHSLEHKQMHEIHNLKSSVVSEILINQVPKSPIIL